MKCPHCGANISFRDEYCAWCGKINEQARSHVSLLRRIQKQEEETREDVTRQTLRRVPLLLRLLVIGSMIIIFGALLFYQIHTIEWDYEKRIRNAVKNADERCRQMDAFLNERDHFRFYVFQNVHQINTYLTDDNGNRPYERFHGYAALNNDYVQLAEALLDLSAVRPGAADNTDSLLHDLAMHLNDFYRTYERYTDPDSYVQRLTGTMLEAADDMKAQIGAMLECRLGIDRADTVRLSEMTESERVLLIEQAGKEDAP